MSPPPSPTEPCGLGPPSPALRERMPRAARRVRVASCLLFVSLAVAGCGKKNPPQPPPGVPNTYPRTYPSA